MNRLSDATLNGMTKKQLIEYVRMCEHNYDIAEETLRQQSENVKDWRPVKHGKWVDYGSVVGMYCSECRHRIRYRNGIRETTTFSDGEFNFAKYPSKNGYYNFCPKCGSFNGGK